jgi:hypothetical protein
MVGVTDPFCHFLDFLDRIPRSKLIHQQSSAPFASFNPILINTPIFFKVIYSFIGL